MPELPVVKAVSERIQARFGDLEVDGVTLLQFSAPAKSTRGKGGVLRVRFSVPPEDSCALFVHEYGRERRVGVWVLAGDDLGPMETLGPEPFDPAFAEWLRTANDRRRLHTMLRDQRTVAGIGRGHADDILHRARLAPTRKVDSLDGDERERLLDTAHRDLEERLELERARQDGLPAKLSEDWRLHGRWGEPCPACGAELARISYEDYEITYCPPCQTKGRVTADRRRSRFLK